jgi:putative tryptophan/tyrosine transport system substrate-binding protein
VKLGRLRRGRGRAAAALIALVAAAMLGMVAVPPIVRAQTPSRVFKLGLLINASATGNKPSEDAFRAGLRELGYIEGTNLVIESRYADGDVERLPALSRELVDMKPDVVVSAGPQALRALRETTSTLPIVSAAVSDPVEEGLVATLAHPGGNITGMAFQNLDLTAKRLELLKETVPDARKIAVLSDATFGRTGGLRQAEMAAERLRLTIEVVEVRGRGDLDEAFRKAREARAQALVVLASPMLNAYRHAIIAAAARARLPATYEFSTYVRDGGLMSYGPSIADMYRRSAVYVDKILKGAKPGDLPIEQASRFELAVNVKTATTLGLTVPPAVLQRADEVVR